MTTRIDEIRERADKATPGDWVVEAVKGYCEDYVVTRHPDYQTEPYGNYVAECGIAAGHPTPTNFQNDSAFIANSRADIPFLLGEIGKLNGLLRTAAGEIAKAHAANLQPVEDEKFPHPELRHRHDRSR